MKPHDNYKKSAITIDLLFLITMIFGMINAYIADPVLHKGLGEIYKNKDLITSGAFLMLFMSIGIVGIAIVFVPIIRKHNEIISTIYLNARILECILLIVGVTISFILLDMSNDYVKTGTIQGISANPIIDYAIKIRYTAYQLAMLILGIASILLCYSLFKTKLIPNILSIWGMIGYSFLIASAILDLCGIIDTVNGNGILLYIPGGLWEFFGIPALLIIKGFNTDKLIELKKQTTFQINWRLT